MLGTAYRCPRSRRWIGEKNDYLGKAQKQQKQQKRVNVKNVC